MNKKFFRDFATWLDQWLQTNVGEDPQRLKQFPVEFTGDELKPIAILRVFLYIDRHHWSAPQQKTADIFHSSRWKIGRAIKKYLNFM